MALAQESLSASGSAPAQVGRYRVCGVLGRGAMGIVYLGHDPQLDRPVALKTILFPENFSRTQRGQLTRSLLEEARLAARLTHPGIMAVYDSGTERDLPFIVLERLHGQTLEQMLKAQGRLSPEVAIDLIRHILEAVAYAHKQEVVHRDIKPANIMVQPDGQPRIMDFGIARALADAPGPQGALAGTPRYMAPEQIQCKPVDQRADVFALGILSYYLLSGRLPFPQENLAMLTEAITRLPHPPLGAAAAELPEGLYLWIERTLAKKPAERYADAATMLEAFNLAVEGGGETGAATNAARQELLSFILKRIERQGDFPATAEYLSIVMRAARDESASAHKISEAILKDFALTNRILRLVNSPGYRGRGGAITTISRAVVILGVDTIMSLATGLTIFEHFNNLGNVRELKLLAITSLMTALNARQLAQHAGYPDIEEAFIAGMLFHLGRLIVGFYFEPEHRAIHDLIVGGEADEEKASRRVMRLSYSEIGAAVAEQWHLPDVIRAGMQGLSPAHSGGLRNSGEELQMIVQFAGELSRATLQPDGPERKKVLAALLRRYSEHLPRLSQNHLQAFIQSTLDSAMDISGALKIDMQTLGITQQATAQRAPTVESDEGGVLLSGGALQEGSLGDGLAPADALSQPAAAALALAERRQDILMRTVMDISSTMMGAYQINDILMMVIEGMFRGLEFQHVLLAMVNPERNFVHCRFGLGPNIEKVRELFSFPLAPAGGLPARCLLEGREAVVLDLDGEAQEKQFPAGAVRMMQARSIILLPIVIQAKPIGCFCVDRGPDQPAPTKQELRDLKTLANQAILAMQHSLTRQH